MAHSPAENATDFQLKWNIFDPFAPWQIRENWLYLDYPERCRWNVQLLSRARNYNSLRFTCLVIYDKIYAPGEVTAETLDIFVTLNGIPVNRNQVLNYPFGEETGYFYGCEVEIEDPGHHFIGVLGILIHIKVKKGGIYGALARRNGAAISLLYGGERIDIEGLTTALSLSQLQSSYCTLRMFSSDNQEISVHHYILQVRWRNLFTEHNLNENSNFVNTNISSKVLSKVIHYMYTGKLDTLYLINNYKGYATEFFQVVWRYEIFHLYETVRQSDKRMSRYAKNYVERRKISIVFSYPVREQSVAFPVYVYPYGINVPGSSAHSFLIHVHVKRENPAGPWLSYSLLSRSRFTFNVRVSLEVEGDGGRLRLVHSEDYNIPGEDKLVSGPILFLGLPQILFGNAPRKRLSFGFTFTDGISSVSIWHPSDPGEFMRERREIFSQHMMEILRREFKTDLVVQPSGDQDGSAVQSYRIHKAIFNARLPGWRNVVEPHLPEGSDLPDTVILPLSKSGYWLVIVYVYTGIILRVPSALRQEILNFAIESNFASLQRLVNSMPE